MKRFLMIVAGLAIIAGAVIFYRDYTGPEQTSRNKEKKALQEKINSKVKELNTTPLAVETEEDRKNLEKLGSLSNTSRTGIALFFGGFILLAVLYPEKKDDPDEDEDEEKFYSNPRVAAIYIRPVAGNPMQEVSEVRAITGAGLEGDCYAVGIGSYNKGKQGKRQVTFINGMFFLDSGFEFSACRRNIVTLGVELMWLIGQEFQIGEARFRGVKYCDPCPRPSNLSGNNRNFKRVFFDRGGLIAEVLEDGIIRKDDPITVPSKNY